MFERKKNKIKKIASDNKLASDNTIKNALILFDNDFSGLKDVISCFIPSMRDEIVLRYRAETIAKIGIEAYRIAKNENIQIHPIPPKIALPLIEKMSLEHEPDIYEKWAKLLIAAGVNPNPIHQQYADLLSNLNKESANFLKEIYANQTDPNAENEYDEYIDRSRFKQCYDDIKSYAKPQYNSLTGKQEFSLPDSFAALNSFFRFPLICEGTEKREATNNDILIFIPKNDIDSKDYVLDFSNEYNKMLLGLEKLSLIKYQMLLSEHKKNKEGNYLIVKKRGVLLTRFGYSFVDCLENPTK